MSEFIAEPGTTIPLEFAEHLSNIRSQNERKLEEKLSRLRIFVIRNSFVELFGKRSTTLNLKEMPICLHFRMSDAG